MGFPWFLKPDLLLHKELLDAQEALAQSAGNSSATDRKQDRQIKALEQRVAELEAQLLALETFLAEKGILPPAEEEAAAAESGPKCSAPGQPQEDGSVRFPARTERTVVCPRCGKCQLGNRDLCIACGAAFRYENEE